MHLGRIEDRAARFGERKLYRICWQTIFISEKPQWYGKPLTQLGFMSRWCSRPMPTRRPRSCAAMSPGGPVPAIYPFREWATAGGLISYGPSFPAIHRQVGIYAGKALKGAKPAALRGPQ